MDQAINMLINGMKQLQEEMREIKVQMAELKVKLTESTDVARLLVETSEAARTRLEEEHFKKLFIDAESIFLKDKAVTERAKMRPIPNVQMPEDSAISWARWCKTTLIAHQRATPAEAAEWETSAHGMDLARSLATLYTNNKSKAKTTVVDPYMLSLIEEGALTEGRMKEIVSGEYHVDSGTVWVPQMFRLMIAKLSFFKAYYKSGAPPLANNKAYIWSCVVLFCAQQLKLMKAQRERFVLEAMVVEPQEPQQDPDELIEQIQEERLPENMNGLIVTQELEL